MTETQSASAVMMIRPLRFTANPLTASTNAFQINDAPQLPPATGASSGIGGETSLATDSRAVAVLAAAQQEFDALAKKLADAGVRVCVFADTANPDKPDAVFPNNWITTHADGTVVLYPMMAVNRRTERRPGLIKRLSQDFGYVVDTIIDFSPYEIQDKILEGTGSMILDRVNRIVYACRSARTDAGVLDEFCDRLGYRVMLFDSVDRHGMAIYHTNVMLTLGSAFAVVCAESVRDQAERADLLASLTDTGHEIIEISYDQMEHFAGNMLELRAGDKLIVAMSQRAHDALTAPQIQALSKHAQIVSSPINTLEDYGGGSVRCMLAEIFLPLEA